MQWDRIVLLTSLMATPMGWVVGKAASRLLYLTPLNQILVVTKNILIVSTNLLFGSTNPTIYTNKFGKILVVGNSIIMSCNYNESCWYLIYLKQ